VDDGVDIGPLINEDAIEKVQDFVEDALAKGGELQMGGKVHSAGDLFFEPTVITGCHADMDLASNEIFGPVAPIFKFSDEAEVIKAANETEYGLAGYFYGRDIGRIWRVAEALEYGIVGVNRGAVSTPVAPFGGVKHSGYGREGSKYGIDEYVSVKYVCVGI
jgi:succinate-semialdehyde dehydrogenase/glutarate-semialdehyde dehydrogenase